MGNPAIPETAAHQAMAHQLERELPALGLGERLRLIRRLIPGRLVFTTSFGIEDQLLTHEAVEAGIDIEFVTLDTGRLFPETLDLWAQTEARYGIRIAVFAPDQGGVERLIAAQGAYGFRETPEARKACCALRKNEPLARALEKASGWITGLRADQSGHRASFTFAEHDAARGLIKLNPLIDWSRERIANETTRLTVPVNALHSQGFLSIGCAPCTRAVQPGEPERAGRWWWEQASEKECGLHISADGKLTRKPEQRL